MNLKDERILLTGASGFFGHHISEAFQARGISVSPSNSAHDLRIREVADELIAVRNPTVVIHCAAHCGGIGLNKEKPAEMFYDNITMGVNLMDAAWRYGVKKFVQLGSVCEYPKFTPVPFSEDDIWNGYPEETNAPYGIAKKALLTMGQAYRAQYDFNVIHLLPVNLYGPGDNFGPTSSHVIPALIKKFTDSKEPSVSVWGSGNAFREFLYVEDAAEAIVFATERYDGAEPVNIGTGDTISIRQLAFMIANKVEYKGYIKFNNDSMDGQPKRCLNVYKADLEFGFSAKTSLSQGLDKTIEWYRRQG